MSASRGKHSSKFGLLRVCVLSSFIYLLCSTCSGVGVMAGNKMASHQPTLRRGRRSHPSARLKGAQHHRPLTEEEEKDQNLQFMLSLYRSAAEPDGRTRQHRKFGSNTVRLLRPSASTVHYLPASPDHHYSFTVHYDLDTLPSEKLLKASFVHLRSSSPSSSSLYQSPRDLIAPRCRAHITSVGNDSHATLEPHEQWTVTDVTAHVQQHGKNQETGGHLILTAQYWCTKPGHADEDAGLVRWWSHRGNGMIGEPHIEIPSLLLYLEEQREVKDWIGELLGIEGENVIRRIRPWPSVRRQRRSKSPQLSELDALKNAITSSSSSSLSFSNSPSASNIPNHRRKTSTPKNRCKLHSFRLFFHELGLGHQIIAPLVYNPRFCRGNCPRVLTYGYHSPRHAIIQTLINDLGVGDVPEPSCVPYKYMPMSVLLQDKKNKVEYREMEDMVAESCTCR